MLFPKICPSVPVSMYKGLEYLWCLHGLANMPVVLQKIPILLEQYLDSTQTTRMGSLGEGRWMPPFTAVHLYPASLLPVVTRHSSVNIWAPIQIHKSALRSTEGSFGGEVMPTCKYSQDQDLKAVAFELPLCYSTPADLVKLWWDGLHKEVSHNKSWIYLFFFF